MAYVCGTNPALAQLQPREERVQDDELPAAAAGLPRHQDEFVDATPASELGEYGSCVRTDPALAQLQPKEQRVQDDELPAAAAGLA